jgi:transcription termination factor 2
MTFKPFQHQLDGLKIMKKMEKSGNGGFLADAMGLGKTISMSLFLKYNKYPNIPDLIVGPYSVLSIWKREILRIKDYPVVGRDPKILIYHGVGRYDKLNNDDWDYVVTTYGIVSTGELNEEKWGRVVLDESHTIRNGIRTQPTKCAKAAFEIGKNSKKNWCVSGTMFCNRMNDIASQCKFLGTQPYNDPYWWKNKKTDCEEIVEWREQYVLRRTKEKFLKPPNYYDIVVKSTAEEAKITKIVRDQAKENFEKWKRATGVEKQKLQGEILGLIQRLRVISNSFYCSNNNDSLFADQIVKDNAKVDVMINKLDEKVSEDPKSGIVVFSQFTSYLNVLETVIKKYLIGVDVFKFTGNMNSEERDIVVDKFNNNTNPRIILVSLLAGGVGLSLHSGSSTVFVSEPYYNPFIEQQAEERVHRLGQKHQVNVYRFTMENSVETWINKLKDKKQQIASCLKLTKKSSAPKEFSFKDLEDLFEEHVSFTMNKPKPKPNLNPLPMIELFKMKPKYKNSTKKYKRIPNLRKSKNNNSRSIKSQLDY